MCRLHYYLGCFCTVSPNYSLNTISKTQNTTICLKAGCNQVAYSIKDMQHSRSVYTRYLYIYTHTHCRQSQSEDYQGPSYSQTKLFYSHLTRISKDAMKQQPEYKNHQKYIYAIMKSYQFFLFVFIFYFFFLLLNKLYGLENIYNIKCTLKKAYVLYIIKTA